jgi:hypothetical protein
LIPRLPKLQRSLAEGPRWRLRLFAALSAFAVYFSMYAFRKPFAAASYPGSDWLGSGLTLKTVLVIGQIVGYTLAKFVGTRVCSQASRTQRARWLLGLILAAELSLGLFGLLPRALKPIALLLDGLALGMVWGLVVRYLEGRRASEVLLAVLSCSFIVASGVVKDIGIWLMSSLGVSEAWMPALTGLIFLLPFYVSLTLLDQLPEPDLEDRAERSERPPMGPKERRAFLRRFPLGFGLLLAIYTLVTAFRDYRDNFGVELLGELGYSEAKGIFTNIELPVALAVLTALALFNLIPSGRGGLRALFAMLGFGAITMAAATWCLDAGQISGKTWMLLIGVGSYLIYVPFGSVLFDRIAAALRFRGNAVFAIMAADGVGYIGSTALLLYRDLGYGGTGGEPTLDFMKQLTFVTAAVCCVGFLVIAVYFDRRCGRE